MTASAPRTSAIARHLFVKQLRDVLGLWLLFSAAVIAVTAIVALFTAVTVSAWEIALQLPRWFALGWGVYLTAVYLPLYIAHGYTRAEFARRALPFVGAFAAVLGALMTLGFAIEAAAYGLLGWPHVLSQPAGLYDTPNQYHLIAAQQLLTFLTWIVVGALGGAGCYRGVRWGTVAVLAGLAVLGVAEASIGARSLGPIPLVFERTAAGLPFSVMAYVLALVLGVALTWLAVRDLPIRSRNA